MGSPRRRRTKFANRRAHRPTAMKATKRARKAIRKLKGIEFFVPRSSLGLGCGCVDVGAGWSAVDEVRVCKAMVTARGHAACAARCPSGRECVGVGLGGRKGSMRTAGQRYYVLGSHV